MSQPLRVLVLHNAYRLAAGEDASVDREVALLREAGHAVHDLRVEARELGQLSWAERLRAPLDLVWGLGVRGRIQQAVEDFGPDVAYVNDVFPWISPAVLPRLRAAGVPVALALRNFRAVCAAASLTRDLVECRECPRRGHNAAAVWHRCRGGLAESALVAGAYQLHRWWGTWRDAPDVYLVGCGAAQDLFASVGFPVDRMCVRPHPVGPDRGPGGDRQREALFAGRLEAGKGVRVLLEAWALDPGLPALRILGDGLERGRVEAAAAQDPRILFEGPRARPGVLEALRQAAVAVVPSVLLETFGRAAVEALMCGTPVVATAQGGLAETVDEEVGAQVPVGDPAALAQAVRSLVDEPAGGAAARRARCRARYLERFADARCLEGLERGLRAAVVA